MSHDRYELAFIYAEGRACQRMHRRFTLAVDLRHVPELQECLIHCGILRFCDLRVHFESFSVSTIRGAPEGTFPDSISVNLPSVAPRATEIGNGLLSRTTHYSGIIQSRSRLLVTVLLCSVRAHVLKHPACLLRSIGGQEA